MVQSKAVTAAATVSRRNVIAAALGAATTAAAVPAVIRPARAQTPANATTTASEGARTMGSRIVTRDGVEIYYKDWGPKDGPVV
ncbi:alpha/beta hydrolase, partial [Sinorhizobium sp. 6-70]|nr:alpha/beta hydrolase [Sinorhizobium sp. 6-70]MDK1480131.1 alpha/beta hydrolase [Sinorhizobium sp. 6-117]